jgi:hypothetical protein
MSAFVVSHDHIDALLTFADRKRLKDRLAWYVTKSHDTSGMTWTDIGRILLAENERSVCHRYPDCVPGDAPGKIGEEAIGYRFRPFEKFIHMPHITLCVWIIKACNCFDYQACETDDYEQSIAHSIIEAIRNDAINCLPGYDAAPWGIDRHRHAA